MRYHPRRRRVAGSGFVSKPGSFLASAEGVQPARAVAVVGGQAFIVTLWFFSSAASFRSHPSSTPLDSFDDLEETQKSVCRSVAIQCFTIQARITPELVGHSSLGRNRKHHIEPWRSEERRVGKEGRCRWSPYH